MESKVYPFALGVWIVLVILAVVNGILRESVYEPLLDAPLARAISSLVLIVLIIIIIYASIKRSSIVFLTNELLWLGTFWLILTVIFEFLFGHFIMDRSWSSLLSNYNILEGHLWPLVLITIFISPYVIGKLTK